VAPLPKLPHHAAAATNTSTSGRRRPNTRAPGAAILATLYPTAPGDLHAAIAAGWIVRAPKPITRRAIRTIHHETLRLALHLDTDDASAFVESMHVRCAQLRDAARLLRERASILARVVGPELDVAVARLGGHARGDELSRERWLRRSANLLADLEESRDHLAAIATAAEIQHGRYRAAVARAEHRSSPKYSGHWRAIVLGWLRRELGGWTLRELAQLIIATATDFTREHRPPCSAFVDGATVDQLADRIKHLLARHR
jgi:hypothetical protein